MKKTLRLAALAAVVSSAFWLPNAYSGYPSCYLSQGKSCSTNNAWKYCDDDGSIGACTCGGSPLTWSCTGA